MRFPSPPEGRPRAKLPPSTLEPAAVVGGEDRRAQDSSGSRAEGARFPQGLLLAGNKLPCAGERWGRLHTPGAQGFLLCPSFGSQWPNGSELTVFCGSETTRACNLDTKCSSDAHPRLRDRTAVPLRPWSGLDPKDSRRSHDPRWLLEPPTLGHHPGRLYSDRQRSSMRQTPPQAGCGSSPAP